MITVYDSNYSNPMPLYDKDGIKTSFYYSYLSRNDFSGLIKIRVTGRYQAVVT